jgi:hypothetical protein
MSGGGGKASAPVLSVAPSEGKGPLTGAPAPRLHDNYSEPCQAVPCGPVRQHQGPAASGETDLLTIGVAAGLGAMIFGD